jgi:hypothetical protein
VSLIDGATGPTYTLTSDDKGWFVWCEVTLSNGFGADAVADSDPVGPVMTSNPPVGWVALDAVAALGAPVGVRAPVGSFTVAAVAGLASPVGVRPARGSVVVAATAGLSVVGERPSEPGATVGAWSDPATVDTTVGGGGGAGFGAGPFGNTPFGA